MFPWLEIVFLIQLSKLGYSYSEVGNYNESNIYSNHFKNYLSSELEIKAYDLIYTDFKTKNNLYNSNEIRYKLEIGLNIQNTIQVGFRNTYIDYNVPMDYDISHPLYSSEYKEIFFRTNFSSKINNFNNIKLKFLLELSKITSGTTQLGINQIKDSLYTKEQYFSTVEAKFLFYNIVYIDFGFKTKMTDTNNYSFYPYQISNKFGLGIIFKNIEFGYRHICIHPESPWDYVPIHDRFNASYDEVFIQYEIELKS